MTLLNLTGAEFALLALIVTCAGIVRGFSGFALSALVMASAVLILPPVELIPICWFLEMTASLLMARDGWRNADRGIVFGLVAGSVIGVPIGLALLTSMSVAASKTAVLVIVIVLAATQLARIRLAVLATRPGLYLSGLVSGIVTGLASVGGMVVALYVLSQDAPAAKMRAALALYLFFSLGVSIVFYLLAGIMDGQAAARGVALSLFAAGGVLIGQRLFTDRLAPYYRPFCLTLLMGLAAMGLIRTQMP